MAKTTKLVMKGVNKVLRDAQPQVNEATHRIAAAAGPGHRAVVYPHRWTARGFVEQVDDAQARRDPNGLSLLRALSQQG